MIAVVQRVRDASVEIDGREHARIGHGLCVLLGVERGDAVAEADWIAGKLVRLRIFRDDEDRMNRSVEDVGGAILLVSQFTLAGDCAKGNRPSFIRAAAPAEGEALYDRVAAGIRALGIEVRTGVFGAMMQVALINDGPVTLIVERR
jgi:D-tyrosyl-tRNA(Tyr) deacylase